MACLAYAVWMVSLGLHDFEMVHDGFRQANERLEPERVREAALRELVAQCRGETAKPDGPRPPEAGRPSAAEDPCLSWTAAQLEERRAAVEKKLRSEWGRAWRKLMLFYLFFGIVFLALPMFMFYLLLAFLLWLRRNLRIIK